MKRWLVRERRGLWRYSLHVSESETGRDVGAFEATPARTFAFRGFASGKPYRFVVRREGVAPQVLTANVIQRAEEGGGERLAASARVPLLWGRRAIRFPDGREFPLKHSGVWRLKYRAIAEGADAPALVLTPRRGFAYPPMDVTVGDALANEEDALALLGLLLEVRRMEQARVF